MKKHGIREHAVRAFCTRNRDYREDYLSRLVEPPLVRSSPFVLRCISFDFSDAMVTL